MRLQRWEMLFTTNQRRGSLAQLCAERRSRLSMAPTLLGLGYASLVASAFTPTLRQTGILFYDDWSATSFAGSMHAHWHVIAVVAVLMFILALPVLRLGILDQLWRNTDLSKGRFRRADRRLRLARRLLSVDFAVIGFLFGAASVSADLSLRPGYLLLLLSAVLTLSGMRMIARAMSTLVPADTAQELPQAQPTSI